MIIVNGKKVEGFDGLPGFGGDKEIIINGKGTTRFVEGGIETVVKVKSHKIVIKTLGSTFVLVSNSKKNKKVKEDKKEKKEKPVKKNSGTVVINGKKIKNADGVNFGITVDSDGVVHSSEVPGVTKSGTSVVYRNARIKSNADGVNFGLVIGRSTPVDSTKQTVDESKDTSACQKSPIHKDDGKGGK